MQLVVRTFVGAAAAVSVWVASVSHVAAQFTALPTINVTGLGNKPTESDYVPNVVKSENGLASFEALKAQAVAARTFAYYKMTQQGFINDGTSDQVYTGNGQSPRQIHYEAAAATEGEILWVRDNLGAQADVLLASFYVAGAIPTGPFNPDNPGIIYEPGDSDPTDTERHVTYPYAEGLVGRYNFGTPLGFIGQDPVNNPNWPNRGAMSQNGGDYLSDNSINYLDILKYYYGADIQVRTATTAGTGVTYGRKVLTTFDDYGSGRVSDGIIDGNEGVFHRSPTFSGSTTANLAGSDAVRDSSTAQQGSHSQRIDVVYDETIGGEFFMRHVAGAKYSDFDGSQNAAEQIANLQFESIGSVGFWLKTTDPGLQVSLGIDDPNTGDRGVRKPVIADGEWHEYKWFLDDASQWDAWAGGNGQIDGVNVSLDSVQLFGSSDATVYLDTVFWDPTDVFDPRTIGDLNGDGDVDAADYTVYRDNVGVIDAGNPADANGDGVVSETDYAVWSAYYGTTTGGATLSVPEPTTVAFAVIVGLTMLTRLERR
ncbi:SpoIID/LytB domain-containing protein [Botrimarina mediterranea]|uniref:Stage II sporulation protein n=1 Tax=Botrimarina mediterranea TaxID=2528022 RepID=A0A518KAG5_9BACT|nr:SpoIID/LytB domain-containing protein [Botrimarina mediterranea]QDV74784.1 Stage II sporulation protein [Botrimarina mediterranea]QDV79428.1 Stage II sporulation protein [Planctomycetes bacterium K2D]